MIQENINKKLYDNTKYLNPNQEEVAIAHDKLLKLRGLAENSEKLYKYQIVNLY